MFISCIIMNIVMFNWGLNIHTFTWIVSLNIILKCLLNYGIKICQNVAHHLTLSSCNRCCTPPIIAIYGYRQFIVKFLQSLIKLFFLFFSSCQLIYLMFSPTFQDSFQLIVFCMTSIHVRISLLVTQFSLADLLHC
jgi:hypothetical protein